MPSDFSDCTLPFPVETEMVRKVFFKGDFIDLPDLDVAGAPPVTQAVRITLHDIRAAFGVATAAAAAASLSAAGSPRRSSASLGQIAVNLYRRHPLTGVRLDHAAVVTEPDTVLLENNPGANSAVGQLSRAASRHAAEHFDVDFELAVEELSDVDVVGRSLAATVDDPSALLAGGGDLLGPATANPPGRGTSSGASWWEWIHHPSDTAPPSSYGGQQPPLQDGADGDANVIASDESVTATDTGDLFWFRSSAAVRKASAARRGASDAGNRSWRGGVIAAEAPRGMEKVTFAFDAGAPIADIAAETASWTPHVLCSMSKASAQRRERRSARSNATTPIDVDATATTTDMAAATDPTVQRDPGTASGAPDRRRPRSVDVDVEEEEEDEARTARLLVYPGRPFLLSGEGAASYTFVAYGAADYDPLAGHLDVGRQAAASADKRGALMSLPRLTGLDLFRPAAYSCRGVRQHYAGGFVRGASE